MKAFPRWATRAWLPYTLAGIVWVTVGAAVLGNPKGLGLIFIGLTCLSFGLSGAVGRGRRGYGFTRHHPPGCR